jgi:hypothetical protein
MPGSNRRRPRRRQAKAITTATLRPAAPGPDLEASLLDLSRKGARLTVNAPLEAGREVELTLDGGGGRGHVRLLAYVVWSCRTPDGNQHAGLKFHTGLRYYDLISFAYF